MTEPEESESFLELQARRLAARAQTLASPKMELVDLAELLLKAGFTREEAITMLAIAGAESGYRTEAKNVDKTHGSEDYGIYQINQIHKPDMERIYDPAYNVEMAKKIYDRQGFTAWVAWDNNKHLPFMDDAEAAVDQAVWRVLAELLGQEPPPEPTEPESTEPTDL